MTTNDERRTIRLVDPLPCSILLRGAVLCGNPATVAHAWRIETAAAVALWELYHETRTSPEVSGYWCLQPVCESCALAAAKVYEVAP